MVSILKPTWWNNLATYFSFSNDASATIDSEVLLSTLDTYVVGSLGQVTSPAFLSMFTSVLQPSESKKAESAHYIPDNANVQVVLGFGGYDFLAGNAGDNILHGGLGNDYFSPGAGRDLVIGSDGTSAMIERDTVAYLSATSGIVVEITNGGVAIETGLLPHQDVYSFSYADWVDPAVIKISDFQGGAGGDFLDISALLAAVGYVGTNPVADGYIKFSTSVDGLKIQFDPDGNAGSQSGKELVRLLGHTTATFSATHNFMLTPLVTHTGEDNFLTFVSNDGAGGYDVLHSVENIYGSDHNDIIHGHTVLANILMGGLGNDTLHGDGGHDILVGGSGNDTLYGGTGSDRIILGLGGDQAYGGTGADIFKFDATIGTNVAANTSDIHDFQTGAGGDKIDISEILSAAGYAGSNPLVDGYLQIVQSGANTHINIDIDGVGAQAAQTLAVLHNVEASSFSATDNLVFSAPRVLYVSALGQSNSEGLRVLGDDTESGLTRIQGGLDAATDFDKIILTPKDENGSIIMPAIGSTRVNGDYGGKPSDSWWFPSTNKPGEILTRAVEILMTQIADMRAAGNNVKPVIVWGQGEGDCVYIGGQTTEAARLNAQNVYKNATLAVFDYIKAHVGTDVEFYIMETGRYITQAALNAGISQATADRTQTGLTYIRAAQEQLASERSDIFIATKYTDLPMNYEYDPAATTDYWHFHPETREIIGDRVADFISLRLGYDHVLDNPGDYPLSMLSDLPLKSHPGMTINGNTNNNIVVGTLGNDTLTGDNGNDALYGGAGFDQVLYQGNYANYTLTTQGSWLIVTDNVFSDGTDTLILIERAVFADGYYENGQFYSTVENRNPEAQDDVFEAEVDTVITGNVLADNGNGADVDLDLDTLTVVAGTFATVHGSVTIAANGNFTYTPNAGYAGLDGFSYTVEDGQGGSDTANVSITLTVPVPNNPPVAQDDIFIGEQDSNIAGNLLVNNGNGVDSDADNDPLNVVAGTYATAHGSVTIMANGGFVYTPNAGYFGTDSFTYTLQDGQGGSDIGQVNLTIEQYAPPANIKPVGVDDGFSGLQDVNITGNLLVDNGAGADSDSDGGTLSVVAGTYATAHGSVTVSANGNFTYTPNAGYTGLDAFRYTLVDGQGGSDLGVVNLNLIPSSVVSGTEANNTITGTGGHDFIRGLGGNDSIYGEAGNDTLYGNAGNDTLKGRDDNDTMFGADGADYLEGGNGNDVMYGGFGVDTMKGSSGVDTFAYLSIYDGGDTIQDFGATSGEKIDLTGLLVHAIGFQQAEAFTGGYLRVEQTGPNTALYVDMDGSAGSGAEVLLATLQGVLSTNITLASFILPASGIASNNPPVAQDDVFTGNQDVQITGNVLVNNGNGADSDSDGGTLSVVAGTFATAHGSVTVSANGNFIYTPNAGYFGADSFAYTLQDGQGGSDIGNVALTLSFVPPTNNPPVAQDDAFTGNQDVQITGNLLADNGNGVDTDADGNPLNVVAGTFATTNGSVTISANGDFTYTPNTGYTGMDGFEYTLQDGQGGLDTGAVALTLNYVPPINNNPVAQDDVFSGNQDVQITGNVLVDNGLGADSDVDSDPLNVFAATIATAHGSVTINADGTFVYTPDTGYFGADSFEYTVEDGQGGSDIGLVNLTIEQFINTPPVAQDDAFTGNQDVQITGNLLANNGNGVDTDADGHPLNVVAGTFATTHGSVIIALNGTFTYTPNAGYVGVDGFEYTLQDGHGGSDTGAVALTLNAVNNDDTFYGTVAAEIFNGGIGSDTVDYSASAIGVVIDLKKHTSIGGDAAGDTQISIENLIGSNNASQRDTLYGDDNVNRLYGMAGDDILQGGGGADILDGGAGRDYARYKDSTSAVNINLETNVHTGGEAQGDLLYNIECVQGSNHNDVIRGGNGNDWLSGEKGNDLVTGGLGVDDLFGGEGLDTFLFEAISAFSQIDRVRDFSLAQGDKIDISDLLSAFDPLTQAITDFVQITDNGVDSFLSVDANGGADHFVQVAIVRAITGITDEEVLVTSGNLVV